MGRQGHSAVKTPALVVPRPMAAVSSKLASVQLRLSMPWSKSSPRPLEVPVRLACLPSTLSIVWYAKRPKAKLKYSHEGPYTVTMSFVSNETALDALGSFEGLTGPTRSGMNINKRPTLATIKENPIRVTMLGATHSGRNSTKAFHYRLNLSI